MDQNLDQNESDDYQDQEEELDDNMFDDPEDFVDDITDEGLNLLHCLVVSRVCASQLASFAVVYIGSL